MSKMTNRSTEKIDFTKPIRVYKGRGTPAYIGTHGNKNVVVCGNRTLLVDAYGYVEGHHRRAVMNAWEKFELEPAQKENLKKANLTKALARKKGTQGNIEIADVYALLLHIAAELGVNLPGQAANKNMAGD